VQLNKLIITLIFLSLSILYSQQSFGEKDSVSLDIPFSKKILWGKDGLIRKLDCAPKTKMEEMKLRHKMLKTHQKMGLFTLGLMAYQSYLGTEMVDNGKYSEYSDRHQILGYTTFASYMTTASLSIGAPPSFRYSKGVSSIKIHRYLSYIHFAGMLSLPYLGYLTAGHLDTETENYSIKAKKAHRFIGNITFTTFSLAFLTTLLP
jgi:hypothetical protein